MAQLKESKWGMAAQEFVYRNVPVRNVIGKAAEGRGPVIILGAHYDTRKRADQDKQQDDCPTGVHARSLDALTKSPPGTGVLRTIS